MRHQLTKGFLLLFECAGYGEIVTHGARDAIQHGLHVGGHRVLIASTQIGPDSHLALLVFAVDQHWLKLHFSTVIFQKF